MVGLVGSPTRCPRLVARALIFVAGIGVGQLLPQLSLDSLRPGSAPGRARPPDPSLHAEDPELARTSDADAVQPVPKPLAVIATTMGYSDNPTKRKMRRNFLRGLMDQPPVDSIKPLVFTDSDELEQELLAEMRKVHREGALAMVSNITEALHGFPTLRSIMRETELAARQAGAAFYGYANGDILFTKDLAATLRLVLQASQAEFFGLQEGQQRGVMITGRRTNFGFSHFEDRLDHDKPCALSVGLLDLAKQGMPAKPWAIDYFIFSVGAKIGWDSIGDWIVGNVAYDNYIIKYAMQSKLQIVDASDTIHAFHQTGSDGAYSNIVALITCSCHAWLRFGCSLAALCNRTTEQQNPTCCNMQTETTRPPPDGAAVSLCSADR